MKPVVWKLFIVAAAGVISTAAWFALQTRTAPRQQHSPDRLQQVREQTSAGNKRENIESSEYSEATLSELIRSNRLQEANALVSALLTRTPSGTRHDELNLRQADIFLTSGDKKQALELYSTLLIRTNDFEVPVSSLAKFTTLAQEFGVLNETITKLTLLCTQNPRNLPLQKRLADILRQAGRLSDEITLRVQIGERFPSDVPNLLNLRSAYVANKDFSSAASTSDRLATVDSDAAGLHQLHKAAFEWNLGNRDNAAKICQQIMEGLKASGIQKSEKAEGLALQTGYLLAELGLHTEAVSAFEYGKEVAISESRKQRMSVEICRQKLATGQIGESERQQLQSLSTTALASRVRDDAQQLLTNSNH